MSDKEMKAMIFGFMYGDGWISHIKNEKYNNYSSGFSGDYDSLKILKDDLLYLYKDIGKAKINTRQTKSPKYGIKGTTTTMAVNTVVAKDFISLGMGIGKKVENDFEIPNWIKKGNKKIKSNFISGLYAAEGYTPEMQKNDKTPKTLGLNITKRENKKENFLIFLKDISNILDDINIKHSYSLKKTFTCQSNIKAIIVFSNSLENIIKTCEILNVRYCVNKKEKNRYIKKIHGVKTKNIKKIRKSL